jgi:hypothetical protein
MNVPAILLWGVVATIVLTTVEAGARGLGWSRMSLPFLVGTAFTPNRDRADLIGLGVHALNGVLFAFVYALVFEALGAANVVLGALMGLMHGLFILAAVMPLLPSLHPRMADETYGPTPTRMLQPAGFFALHYGRATGVVVLVAHMLYGAILGGLYQPVH